MAVFYTACSPELVRVCEKRHRGSKSFIEAFQRTTTLRDFFLHNLLFQLKLADAFFIGTDHGIRFGIDNAI
ncbi:MAG: hypothetical protein JAY67_19485 [Candidatus Thiodiazotropha taylori]|nr:hypothetical protein [Candidatus Thiodiazotropha taylori]